MFFGSNKFEKIINRGEGGVGIRSGTEGCEKNQKINKRGHVY